MRFLSMMGNSFGCSASGERLVSAARDGDIQEAKALLECNPRLGRYSTFGVRNSPLHYSAAQGHHEIVSLLLESGVDINLRNYRGQTALMQACHNGHWEVVLTLILYKANIHKADYLTGGTALHFAAANGHPRCIRLLLVNYIPSVAGIWNVIKTKDASNAPLEESELSRIINEAADGGITALHMAALNGHVECVQLLLDLGASVSKVTMEDGTTIDLIGKIIDQSWSLMICLWFILEQQSTVAGAGSTPLHYAACGGNAQCCQVLVSRGANLTTENANGWTPLLVARLWNRHWLEGVLSKQPESRQSPTPSPYLWIPLMSIVKIARFYSNIFGRKEQNPTSRIPHSVPLYASLVEWECGWRTPDALPTCGDPCSVCLERNCSVSAEGCGHELCTQCALYLCCTNSTTASSGSLGSISCPFCRQGIVSFAKLPGTCRIKEAGRPSLSLSLCTTFSGEPAEPGMLQSKPYRSDFTCTRISPFSSSFRSLSSQRFGSMKLNTSFCMGSETCPSLVPCSDRRAQNQTGLRTVLQRSASNVDNRRRVIGYH